MAMGFVAALLSDRIVRARIARRRQDPR